MAMAAADQQQVHQQPRRSAVAVREGMDRGEAEMGFEGRCRRRAGLFEPSAKCSYEVRNFQRIGKDHWRACDVPRQAAVEAGDTRLHSRATTRRCNSRTSASVTGDACSNT